MKINLIAVQKNRISQIGNLKLNLAEFMNKPLLTNKFVYRKLTECSDKLAKL